jgi:hypothetical protein
MSLTMRPTGVILGCIVAALSSGCSLYTNAARNLCNEPCLAWEECRFQHQARSLAREAWSHYRECDRASRDFRDGYIDGYADYLSEGRITDPPPAPPKHYLKRTYQTPESLRAIEDWFAGFHAGATDAHASGQRGRMVVPVIFPIKGDDETMPAATPGAKPDELPAPQELPKRPEATAAARLRAPK